MIFLSASSSTFHDQLPACSRSSRDSRQEGCALSGLSPSSASAMPLSFGGISGRSLGLGAAGSDIRCLGLGGLGIGACQGHGVEVLINIVIVNQSLLGSRGPTRRGFGRPAMAARDES